MKKRLRYRHISNFIIGILLVGQLPVVFAQGMHDQLSYRSLTIEEGLPNNKVNAITVDKYGFVWFATNDGLCRYDGMEMKIYNLDPLNTSGININHINDLYTDIYGNLWIGAFSLFRYNYEIDSIVHYNNQDTTLKLGRIRAMANNKDSLLWIGSTSGLFSYKVKNDSLVAHPFINNEIIEVLSLLPDDNNILLGIRKYGLFKYQIDQNKFQDINLVANMGDQVNKILCLYKDHNNIIWAGTDENGIYQFNFTNSTYKKILPDPANDISNRVRSIIQDSKGNVWIGTRAGIFIQFPGTENLYPYPNNKQQSFKNSVFDIYIDHHKNMWVGTYANGVKYMDLTSKPFFNYSKNEKIKNWLSDELIYGFSEDIKGNLYIGTDKGGLNYLDIQNETFVNYLPDPNNPYSIGSDNVKSILKDKKENLWIGTSTGGLNYFDTQTKKFTRFMVNKKSNSIQSNDIYSLLIDPENYLWIATNKGIDRMNLDNFVIENVFTLDDVLTLYQDDSERIWVGFLDRGLFLYNKARDTFEPFHKNHLTFGIRSILVDSRGNLWTGGDNGLSFFNFEDNSYLDFTRSRGLPTNLIMGILEDGNKNLWVSTSAGLVKCINAVNNPRNFKIRVYTSSDGLQNKHFLYHSYFKNSKGELFFGGVNGFSRFYPDSIKDNNFIPEIALTKLEIFNKPVKVGQNINGLIVLDKVLNLCNEIALSYKHKIFTIEFTALHYANPKNNQYKYMMFPLQKEWITSDASRRNVTFSDLSPGKYVFRVIAANSDGIWNEKARELKITILPPFWNTIWFKISISLIIILLIVIYYYYKINKIENQKKNLEILVNKRTKEITEKNNLLKNQTDELIRSNTLLEIQKKQIAKQAKVLEIQKTELIDQQDLLKELNSMKDKLLSIIAHDLKGPFHGVLGLMEHLCKEFEEIENSDKKKYLDSILSSSRNVYDLLENLLCWARFQIDHIQCNKNEFDLTEIITKNKALFNDSLRKKFITVKELYSSPTLVKADVNMIDTVIRNLLSNAVKYTKTGGIIEIMISRENYHYSVTIKDNGIGMSREEKENLFRIDKLNSRPGTDDEKGTGLGLIICHDFIQKNGGEFWVESEIDKGSSFSFTLPI